MLRRPWVRAPAGSGAVVMATGIVSIALWLAHQRTLSQLWLGLTAVAWLTLVAMSMATLIADRRCLAEQAGTPAALTAIAATAVLGSRLMIYGATTVARVLLVVGLALWLALSLSLIGRGSLPRSGSSFMVTVAVQSLVVLGAASTTSRLELFAVIGGCLIGIAAYPVVLRRFDLRQILSGAGDHWVAGGALAISSLAVTEIALTAARLRVLTDALPAIHVASVALWAAGVAWLPLLLAGELYSRRTRYDFRRWSTVFPVGMYAVSSFELARVIHAPVISTLGMAIAWVALAAWLVVCSGTMKQVWTVIRCST